MGKKKKQIIISEEELTPTVLATVKEKKVNFFAMILLFGLFISVIYFLPEINKLYEKYKNEESVINPNINTPNEDENNEEIPEEEKYTFSNTLEIVKDNYKINNFKYESNLLTFDIVNTGKSSVNLNNTNNYIEIFDNNTLIKRIKLEDLLSVGSTKSYSYTLNITEISHLKYNEIAEADYPSVKLSEDEEGYGNLECTIDDDSIVYKFVNNKLVNIEEKIILNVTDENYQKSLSSYQTLIANYDLQEGITGTITNTTSTYFINIFINLSKATIGKLNNKDYYGINTEPKVIKFEMESRGYSCK